MQPLTVKKLSKIKQDQADNLPCLLFGAHTVVRAQVRNCLVYLSLLIGSAGSNNTLSYSFFSDLTNPPKSHLNANNATDSNSDEEDRGDFLMIKPLTTTVVNPKFNQPLKTQNFNLSKKKSYWLKF